MFEGIKNRGYLPWFLIENTEGVSQNGLSSFFIQYNHRIQYFYIFNAKRKAK
jgi:hypothetical protein